MTFMFIQVLWWWRWYT